MTEDGILPTSTPAPQPEKTVFQQPTSGFAAAGYEPVIFPVAPVDPTVFQKAVQAEQKNTVVMAQVEPKEDSVPVTQVEPPIQAQQQQQPRIPEEEQQQDYDEQVEAYDYSGYFPDALRPQPEELLYSWSAPSRPFKKHNRNYYTTIAVIVLLISLILVFAGQFIPMAVVCAVAFMVYVINSVPPEEIQYGITTYGVRIGEKLYYWDMMTRFWYGSKYDQKLLYIQIVEFPDRLTLVIGDAKQEILTSIFAELLLLEKPPLTTYEKIAKWLQDKFPLDLDS